MLRRNITFIFLVSFLALVAWAESPPSKQDVQTWWSAKSTEEMTIEGDLKDIRLLNKEVAYLVPVSFYQRGRNFIWHMVMVRPRLKEVREVDDPVRGDIEVLDLNRDGVSEVIAVSLGSGQGTTIGVKALVQFDGWKPIVLHESGFEDNEGAYGEKSDRFHSRSVEWKFSDLNGDGIDDLIEEVTTQKGRKDKSPITTKVRHEYLFKENRFIKYDYKKKLQKGN